MFLKHNLWLILWAILILVLCGIPGKDIPKVSFLEAIPFDKFVHLFLFFILIFLALRGFSLQTSSLLLQKHTKVTAFIISVLYGAAIELMQEVFFTDRSGDLFDFIADSVGVTLGLIFNDRIREFVLARFPNN